RESVGAPDVEQGAHPAVPLQRRQQARCLLTQAGPILLVDGVPVRGILALEVVLRVEGAQPLESRTRAHVDEAARDAGAEAVAAEKGVGPGVAHAAGRAGRIFEGERRPRRRSTPGAFRHLYFAALMSVV